MPSEGVHRTVAPRAMIYCINYAPEVIGVGRYAGELGAYLTRTGVDLEVVTTPPHYPGWTVPAPFVNRYATEGRNGARIFRCPMRLKPAMGGLARMLAPLSFALTSAPLAVTRALIRRPRVLLATEPGLFTAPAALLAARLCGAKAVLHVQDLEVEAAFAVRHLKGRRIQAMARAFDRSVLRLFDEVVTISDRMREALIAAGAPAERTSVVRNWVDLSAIRPLGRPSAFRAELGLPPERRVILYAGNIGAKQALDSVVAAAERLKLREDILFVIAGEGPEKARLAAAAGRNVLFLPLQPEEKLCELLNLADLHVLPQHADAADLVLPSKLGGMLASGKPIVVQAAPATELWTFLEGAARRVPPGDIDALAAAIADERPDSPTEIARRAELARMLSTERVLPGFAAHLFAPKRQRSA